LGPEHSTDQCPHPADIRKKCFECGETGHVRANCPKSARRTKAEPCHYEAGPTPPSCPLFPFSSIRHDRKTGIRLPNHSSPGNDGKSLFTPALLPSGPRSEEARGPTQDFVADGLVRARTTRRRRRLGILRFVSVSTVTDARRSSFSPSPQPWSQDPATYPAEGETE